MASVRVRKTKRRASRAAWHGSPFRRNPRRRSRRRRNPFSIGSAKGILGSLIATGKDAAMLTLGRLGARAGFLGLAKISNRFLEMGPKHALGNAIVALAANAASTFAKVPTKWTKPVVLMALFEAIDDLTYVYQNKALKAIGLQDDDVSDYAMQTVSDYATEPAVSDYEMSDSEEVSDYASLPY